MKAWRAWIVAVALLAPGAAFADDKSDMEAFMRDYLRLWNLHDAGAITAKIYRLEGDNPRSSKEGLQAEFDRLKADGYDHTDTHSVIGCMRSEDRGDVELRYTRLKADGTPMPPKDRISIYHLRKFPDGWRVTGFSGPGPEGKMICPAKP